MRFITNKTLAAAALAALVPQLAQAAQFIYVTPLAAGQQGGLVNAPIRVFDTNGSLVNPSFTGTSSNQQWDIAFDTSGNAYVAKGTTTERYDSTGAALGSLTGIATTSYSVAVGPLDGALFVSSTNTGSGAATGLRRFANPAVNTSTDLFVGGTGPIPDSSAFIAFDPVASGGVQTLYLSTYSGSVPHSAVRKVGLDATGAVVVAETDFASAAALNMTEAEGIAIGGGFVYIADYGGKIDRFTMAGVPAPAAVNADPAFFANNTNGTTDIVLDSAGNLYALNAAQWYLTKYLPTGALDLTFGNSASYVDGPGQVYMDTTPGPVYDQGDYAPWGLGILEVAVPEPTSLALLGLGTMACTYFRPARRR